MNIDVQIREALKLFADLPRFPDGRIDYSNANTSLVLTCFVTCKDELLLLKRSEAVGTYKGKWNVVAGFIDEPKPFVDKVMEELQEEIGLDHAYVETFTTGIPHRIDDDALGKTWIVVPARVELSERRPVKLDWEHSEYAWVPIDRLTDYDLVTGLAVSFEAVRG